MYHITPPLSHYGVAVCHVASDIGLWVSFPVLITTSRRSLLHSIKVLNLFCVQT